MWLFTVSPLLYSIPFYAILFYTARTPHDTEHAPRVRGVFAPREAVLRCRVVSRHARPRPDSDTTHLYLTCLASVTEIERTNEFPVPHLVRLYGL